jgi:hypothetical protein
MKVVEFVYGWRVERFCVQSDFGGRFCGLQVLWLKVLWLRSFESPQNRHSEQSGWRSIKGLIGGLATASKDSRCFHFIPVHCTSLQNEFRLHAVMYVDSESG